MMDSTTEVSTEELTTEEELNYNLVDVGVAEDMTLLEHTYITQYPLSPTEQDMYLLHVRQYNLTLLLVWLIILIYGMQKIFIVFNKFYDKRKG